MCNISPSWDQIFEVNCVPQSEVIVSGTPKREIQEKSKVLVHATAEVSDKRTASIHLMCDQLQRK
jgi:hypothetical protein